MKHLALKKMKILQNRHQKELANFKNNKVQCGQDFAIKISSTLGDVYTAEKHSK